MVLIEDGKGNGFKASVNSLKRLGVDSRQANREFYNSRDFGQLYAVLSEDVATADGEETIYLQNTSTTRTMYVDKIIIASDAAYEADVKFVTGTAAGASSAPASCHGCGRAGHRMRTDRPAGFPG